MKRWRRFLGDSLGGLTLVGALLLATPGVQLARADSAAEQSGPVCSSATVRRDQDPSLETFLTQIRQQAAARLTSEERDPDGWVVLNNRGYNYTSASESPQEGLAPPPASRAGTSVD